jgi:hypothetical protein
MLGAVLLVVSLFLSSLVFLVIELRKERKFDQEIRTNFNQNRRDLIIDQYGEDW